MSEQLAAAGPTEGKGGSWVPGSPFFLCLLLPPSTWSGVSICCLSLCGLISNRQIPDPGQED